MSSRECFDQHCTIFKYGMNRYYVPIWIHPNDTHLCQPFGTKSDELLHGTLLATPVLGTIPINSMNKIYIREDIDPLTYDFYDNGKRINYDYSLELKDQKMTLILVNC